jgi:hypothetical protein
MIKAKKYQFAMMETLGITSKIGLYCHGSKQILELRAHILAALQTK